MTVPTVACTNCGKPFTTDDLRGTHCKYCGTLLAHHARAQEQVAVINQMMADRNGNGIPDAYEGLVANAQANAMNQAFGMGSNPYYGMGPQAPPMGAPVMGAAVVVSRPGMHVMTPMHPHAQFHAAHAHQQVGKALGRAMIFVVVGIVFAILLTVGIGFASFFLAR